MRGRGIFPDGGGQGLGTLIVTAQKIHLCDLHGAVHFFVWHFLATRETERAHLVDKLKSAWARGSVLTR